MPTRGKRAAVASEATSTRQSPRKRKRDSVDPESIPQPSRHEVDEDDIKPEHNKETKTNGVGKEYRGRKDDVVVDEPARTGIALDQVNKKESKSNRIKSQSKLKKTKAAEELAASDLSSVPDDEETADPQAKKIKKPRKTKEDKDAEAMPLAARTSGLKMFVGAHVSIAKGVENAITNAVHIGGNAMAMFLQSQRKWENPELKAENREAFMHACDHHKYDAKSHIVPHGSYLVNLAAKSEEMGQKSYKFFLNDLKRCESLGIRYYNFHPGATNKEPLNEAIQRPASRLNDALAATTTVTPPLENMAGTESIIGSRFSDLRDIIALIKPEFQSRIGICIDTCHTFAAGYDLRSPEAFKKTFQELDDTVGLKYLKAMHINDSKGTFNSHKDLHQNIGVGFLGLRAFHNVMNDVRLQNVPLILETPCEKPDPKDPKKTIDDKTVWSREIKLLESLIGMDAEGAEFQKLEKELSNKGKEERDKMEKWMEEKEHKEQVKAEKARNKLEKAEKGQKKLAFGKSNGKGSNKKAGSDSELSDAE